MIKKKKYNTYEEYVRHQGAKLNKLLRQPWAKGFEKRRLWFRDRLGESVSHITGCKVLCLGARTGEEVLAFRDLGFSEAIGLDLNPGPNNEYVKKGDFHNLEDKDGSLDAIYTNALDHAFDLSKIEKEIFRTLKPQGTLILEFGAGLDNVDPDKHLAAGSGKYESLVWENYEEIVSIFANKKKRFKKVANFKKPHVHWNSEGLHADYYTVILKKL